MYKRQTDISADGRYLVFKSEVSLVASDTNGTGDIYLYDRSTSAFKVISVASDGTQANGASYRPSISADGQSIAFLSNASNLAANDTNSTTDAFLHNTADGSTIRVSAGPDGADANGAVNDLALAANGLQVTFQSTASNLVSNDSNSVGDIFLYNRAP